MMTINANTKIAAILKHHPDALEAIVSLSQRFTKLRNPLLRKVIAARTSIAMASQLGGCGVDDFFNKLQPLGFNIDQKAAVMETVNENKPVPAFMQNMTADKIVVLDVRPVMESGKDPLDMIVKKIKTVEPGWVLKIINSFEPSPLMLLLGKQGFESYAETISNELVYTYFYKMSDISTAAENIVSDHVKDWDEILNRFKGSIQTMDVRALEMPLPMHSILEGLSTLSNEKAMLVYHKRIPVFLLPELEEQQFSYRIKEISDAEVHLLIYKN